MTIVPFNFELRVGQARALKAKISDLKEKHKAELEPFNTLQAQLDTLILAALNQSGLQNTSGPTGGCHKVERITYSLESPDEFKCHVIGTESWDLLDWKANATAAGDYILEHKALPPGVKRSVFLTVGYTVPTKKAARTPAAKQLAPPSAPPSAPQAVADTDTL